MFGVSPLGPVPEVDADSPAQPTTAPIGIKVVCLIGTLSTLIAVHGLLPGLTAGGMAGLLSTGVLLLAGVQLAGFVGLWRLRFWGWAIVIGGFLLGGLLSLFLMNLIGVLVQWGLAYYVYRANEYYL